MKENILCMGKALKKLKLSKILSISSHLCGYGLTDGISLRIDGISSSDGMEFASIRASDVQ